jgi:hypothetical protein
VPLPHKPRIYLARSFPGKRPDESDQPRVWVATVGEVQLGPSEGRQAGWPRLVQPLTRGSHGLKIGAKPWLAKQNQCRGTAGSGIPRR